MSAGLLDVILVLVLAAYAVSGYRHGLIASVFSLGGFFGGAMLAVWLLPALLGNWDALERDGRLRVFVLIVGVVGLGWVGQFLGNLAGAHLRRQVDHETARRADSIGGAVVVAIAASLIIWFLGGSLRTAGNPALAKSVAESKVMRGISAVVPESAGQIFAGFRGFLSSQGFPQVFGGLAPEPITPVPEPDVAITKAQGVATAARSVVKITTSSDSCARGQEGTGWVVAPERIVTNAHVVAGADDIRVEGRNQTLRGRVVVFDPDRDLAVISVPGFSAPRLPLGTELQRGQSAAVPGYPLDGPYRVVSARVRAVLDARGLDIYGRDDVVREIYSLNTTVQPGNSGGPLIDAQGRVVGVVFAKSLEDERTGYALTLDEAAPVLQAAESATREVDTGSCMPG